jgi:hypothetical protein
LPRKGTSFLDFLAIFLLGQKFRHGLAFAMTGGESKRRLSAMKKMLTILMLALPLTACDRVSREDAQALKTENDRLAQENGDLKVKVAKLEERLKYTAKPGATVATAAKPKAKTALSKAPEQASPAEKEALTEAVTGGGSFK